MHYKEGGDNTKLFKKFEKSTTDAELSKMINHATEDSEEANRCIKAYFSWGADEYEKAMKEASCRK